LSDFDFLSDDSSSSEEDEKGKHKQGDFDSDVSDDLSLESVSLRIVELENALCNQDKLF
jgi:hypothetical protein